MSGKAEIGWNARAEDGTKREVYAHRVGREWRFFERTQRYDVWRPVAEPPLTDWVELLDAVERRVHRRLQRPEEPDRIRQLIRERFPEAAI